LSRHSWWRYKGTLSRHWEWRDQRELPRHQVKKCSLYWAWAHNGATDGICRASGVGATSHFNEFGNSLYQFVEKSKKCKLKLRILGLAFRIVTSEVLLGF